MGDPKSRRSVSGFILYVLGVLVFWKLKAQRSVTLLSSKAEQVASSEVIKEVMCVTQSTENMKIPLKLPVMVKVDKVGAIFMASNITTTSCIKHVDREQVCK